MAVDKSACGTAPFFDLIETRGEVICPLHLGLMQGAMASLGQDTTIERLEPFARPDLCLAHVGKARG